jgi:ketosteroid isomerase-like protein
MAENAAEREIRALFEAWSRASSAKDIERTMAPIARDVLSYEHEAPLQYKGLEAIREVCQHVSYPTTPPLGWQRLTSSPRQV